MTIDDILRRPILTEKSVRLAQSGCFTFMVNTKASKKDVTRAVKDQFKVDVVSVKTMIMKGKTRRVGKARTTTKISPWKKAIVQLKKDQKIDLFDIR